MSSGRPSRPLSARGVWRRNTLGVRLTLGYALLFVLSAALLFGLTYGLLGLFLERQDQAFVDEQTRRALEAYAENGVTGVRLLAAELRADDRGEEVLFRIVDAEGRTVLLIPPDEWRADDFRDLEHVVPREGDRIQVRSEREDEEATVTTHRLPGGARLQIGISSDERSDVMDAIPPVFVAITLPLFLLAFLSGAFMARRALSPIRHLVRTLDAIAHTGDVRKRAPAPDEQGEFADLFRLFNRMLDRIEALVAGLRDTLDNVAHVLRTPLTRLRGTAEVALREDRDAPAYREALAVALEAAEALTVTLDAMMDVAEAEAGALRLHRQPVRLADLAADAVALYEMTADEKDVSLRVSGDAEAVAEVDRVQMRRALANLIDNAVKYTPAGGEVTVRVRQSDGGVDVAVADSGVGIAPDDLPRIWDRLYRGDQSRSERGLGLGLSLVRAIVDAHGGRVGVENRPGVGTTFTVPLPRPGEGDPVDGPLSAV